MVDAGGLVIASDHAAARAYARLLSQITGEPPVVVLSDIAVPLISADQPMAAGSIAWILRTVVSTRCTPADAMKLSVLQVERQLDLGLGWRRHVARDHLSACTQIPT